MAERVKTMQANWIGRSEGAEVEFALCDADGEPTGERITVFTTRPDTLFGCTFFLLAPEHPLVKEFVAGTEYESAVTAVVAAAARETAVERQLGEREKNGAFTGRYVVNPVNGEKVPVWVTDYVLMEYGTGAVMAVPSATSATSSSRASTGCRYRRSSWPTDDALLERARAASRSGCSTMFPGPRRTPATGVMVQSGQFTGMRGGKDSEGMQGGHRVA